MSLTDKLLTYPRLGLANIGRVAQYRLQLKRGRFRQMMPVAEPLSGPFFDPALVLTPLSACPERAADTRLFGDRVLPHDKVPQWHRSVLSGVTMKGAQRHWTLIDDFDNAVGDIKGIWEPSRFTWVLDFALCAREQQAPEYLQRLNQWLSDWSLHNAANQGPNWKCAQETSLRVLHLAAAHLVLGQPALTKSLQTLLVQHLQRIEPTLSYARAQDNNHGTSEAAALFIGGSWLQQEQSLSAEGARWRELGKTYLHERVARLIAQDGTFSQYSVTYHRLMLDTLSLCELWRRNLNIPPFAEQYCARAASATKWLVAMIDAKSGDAPNLGANDGAHILNYTGCAYRDFRPSAELAARLFCDASAYACAPSDWLADLFALNVTAHLAPQAVTLMPDGGYAVLQREDAKCVLRFPAFQFRPGQADLLHLDLWVDGHNLLRDGGSYSYNTDAQTLDYFSGVASHNTVQFDGREPMPRLSRFLFGRWPNAQRVEYDAAQFSVRVAYADYKGATHERALKICEHSLTVEDKLSGQFDRACLRWRLLPGEWQLQNATATKENISVNVQGSHPLSGLRLAQGRESRYYGRQTALPVLEADVSGDTTITTTIRWA